MVVIVTGPVVKLTWSVAPVPNVTAPFDKNVRPSKFTTALLSVVATVPAAIVTSPPKVIAPAPIADVMPVAVPRVLTNVVVPVELIVRDAPTPSPIGVTEPTAALKVAASAVFKIRS